jgi:predicted ferric reductase
MAVSELEVAPTVAGASAATDQGGSPLSAVALIVLYLAALVLPLALAATHGRVPAGQFIKQLALGFGLAGLMIIATSFILAARYKWITQPFGLDAVMLFHRRMAIAGFCAILVHLALLSYLNIGLLTRLWLPWHLQLGRMAILLLTAQVVVSVYRAGLRVEFEKWRLTHRLLGLSVLVIAFAHGFLSSGAFAPWPLRIAVLILVAAAFWSIAWSHIFRPSQLKNYRYDIHEVHEISRGLWQVKLKPAKGGRALQYHPGQFAFFHFHRSGADAPGEEHVWTIASSPSEPDGLMLAIKELGDFTRTIGSSKPGDAVTVHGPFGRFSHHLHSGADELVFIAAGIGITPFRSMIRWMTDRAENRRVLLLYANKSAEDIAFGEELEECQNRSGGHVRVVHVLSRPDETWMGEKGHINIELIRKYCTGDLTGKSFWICGPGAFTTSIIQALRDTNVPAGKIHNEAFCLLHAPVQSDGRGRRLKALCVAISVAVVLMVVLFALIRTDFLTARHGQLHHHHPQRQTRVRLKP